MLPEIGATEWMVIAAVVLIVIGPKDLPVLMRKIGQFVGRLRGMANDFRSSFDEMARQSELEDLRREVAAIRLGALEANLDVVDDGHVNKVLDEIDASLRDRVTSTDDLRRDEDPDAEPAVLSEEASAKTPRSTAQV